MKKVEVLKYIGDMSQICGAKMYRLEQGKQHGTLCIEVNTGSGLSFVVVADRGLDIAQCIYKGKNVSYLSKTGIVSPSFYKRENEGFFESFYGGLLTTCGLTQVGPPCCKGQEFYPFHGDYNNIPAKDIAIVQKWEGNDYIISIRGVIREAKFFGKNLQLVRNIKTKFLSNRVTVIDEIENLGFEDEPLMLLYHFNIGWPFLDKDSLFSKSESEVVPLDTEAEKDFSFFERIDFPTLNYKEKVFIHSNFKNKWAFGQIYNPNLLDGVGVRINFKPEQLPYLVEWKQFGLGEYVFGIEPATNYPLGRVKESEAGRLMKLKPGEIKQIELVMEIILGENY